MEGHSSKPRELRQFSNLEEKEASFSIVKTKNCENLRKSYTESQTFKIRCLYN